VEGLAWEGGKVCYGEDAGLGRVVLDDGGLVDMWLACKNLLVSSFCTIHRLFASINWLI